MIAAQRPWVACASLTQIEADTFASIVASEELPAIGRSFTPAMPLVGDMPPRRKAERIERRISREWGAASVPPLHPSPYELLKERML